MYYRRVALLKEFYLLSSLLTSFAGSYFLHASLLEGEGGGLDLQARDLLFGKTFWWTYFAFLLILSTSVSVESQSFMFAIL